jgi:hypothetical protein
MKIMMIMTMMTRQVGMSSLSAKVLAISVFVICQVNYCVLRYLMALFQLRSLR